MKISNMIKRAIRPFRALHTADKCLLVFMTILMFQSAHNLFASEIAMQGGNVLDVVIRTTAAAIFGYFISANFQNGGEDTAEEIPLPTTPPICDSTEKYECRNRLQILVVTCVGIFSLILLIIARNCIEVSQTSASTISQLRDFVSGSVGFLIGHSTHKKKSS